MCFLSPPPPTCPLQVYYLRKDLNIKIYVGMDKINQQNYFALLIPKMPIWDLGVFILYFWGAFLDYVAEDN